MSTKVTSLNKSFEKKLGAVDSSVSRSMKSKAEAIDAYKKKMEEGKTLKLNFTAFGQAGLSLVDDSGVLVILPSETKDADASANDRRWTPMRNSLDYTIEVNVKTIDEANGVVTVEAVGSSNGSRVSTSLIVRNELSREIHAGRRPVVYGRIGSISADGDKAVVNIYGMNIVGFINVRKWKKGYTRTLHSVCEVGDYYPFEVVKFAPAVKGKEAAFILDRTEVAEDPWQNPMLQDLHEGDTIMVKCIDLPAGKSYWWGVSSRVPGIEIMGDFTRRFPSGTGIVPGLTYKCNIRNLVISEDVNVRSKFQVVPIDVSTQDSPTLQSMRKKIELEKAVEIDNQLEEKK